MVLQEQNILFFTRTMSLGGTENVILQLCEIFKPLVNKIVVCSSGGINEDKLAENGIRHYTIPDIERKSLPNLICISNTVRRIIDDEKITVIHTHHRMAAFYCQLIGAARKVICINTSHTAFYDKKLLTHIAFRNFFLLACGEGVKDSLVNGLGFKEEGITVICNGVKSDTSCKRDPIPEIQTAKQLGKTVFSVIGRLSEEKGVEYLIRAMKHLNHENLLCVIVGDGPEESKLRKLTEELQLKEMTVFLGYRKDVPNIIRQVDFLVQPSLQEGLSLTLIEAFSEGRTVIATKISGSSEIVKDSYNGLLVSPANGIELADAIRKMCSLDRSELEKNAFTTYREKYSFTVFSQKYIQFYESV